MTAKLTPRQRRAIEALIMTGQVTLAAEAARVSRETIYKWMKSPAFAQALQAGEQEALVNLQRELVLMGNQAATTLQQAMTDKSAAFSTRIRAADIVLSRLLQIREIICLEARITALESQMKESNHVQTN